MAFSFATDNSSSVIALAVEPPHGGHRVRIGLVHIDEDSTTLANVRQMIPLASGLDPPPPHHFRFAYPSGRGSFSHAKEHVTLAANCRPVLVLRGNLAKPRRAQSPAEGHHQHAAASYADRHAAVAHARRRARKSLHKGARQKRLSKAQELAAVISSDPNMIDDDSDDDISSEDEIVDEVAEDGHGGVTILHMLHRFDSKVDIGLHHRESYKDLLIKKAPPAASSPKPKPKRADGGAAGRTTPTAQAAAKKARGRGASAAGESPFARERRRSLAADGKTYPTIKPDTKPDTAVAAANRGLTVGTMSWKDLRDATRSEQQENVAEAVDHLLSFYDEIDRQRERQQERMREERERERRKTALQTEQLRALAEQNKQLKSPKSRRLLHSVHSSQSVHEEEDEDGDDRADARPAEAIFEQAMQLLESGRGEEAVPLYRRAARRGHAQAQFMIGLMHYFGRGGLRRDAVKAARWWTKAADQNEPSAERYLADMFDRGEGHLPVDHQESARLRGEVCAAAAHGDAEAERAVKSMLRHGNLTAEEADRLKRNSLLAEDAAALATAADGAASNGNGNGHGRGPGGRVRRLSAEIEARIRRSSHEQAAAAGPAAAAAAAQHDWKEAVCASTGRKYWYSHARKKSSWEVPPEVATAAAAAAATATAAAAGDGIENDWQESVDESGRPYYYSHKRKKSAWSVPPEVAAAAAAAQQQQEGEHVKNGEGHDWEEAQDPDTGEIYWYSHSRKKSTWTIPPELARDEPPAAAAAAASDDGIENDWQESVDESSGRPYWYSHKRKKSAWTVPQGFEGAAAAAQDPSEKETPGEDWDTVWSDEHQRNYYVHRLSQITKWELPAKEA